MPTGRHIIACRTGPSAHVMLLRMGARPLADGRTSRVSLRITIYILRDEFTHLVDSRVIRSHLGSRVLATQWHHRFRTCRQTLGGALLQESGEILLGNAASNTWLPLLNSRCGLCDALPTPPGSSPCRASTLERWLFSPARWQYHDGHGWELIDEHGVRARPDQPAEWDCFSAGVITSAAISAAVAELCRYFIFEAIFANSL